MKGASFSILIRDLNTGKNVVSYDADRLLTPASVMKTVTTSAALSILGEDYRYPTSIEYDGEIDGSGVLNGNLYIKGSGDPSLGSSHVAGDNKAFMGKWVEAVKASGIKRVNGKIISDESIFDTEGVSPKWVYEDLGSYYGAGSYGLSVFDNKLSIYLDTFSEGTKPEIVETVPEIDITFHNYLRASSLSGDSCYVVGAPFASDRFMYGTVPCNKEGYRVLADIPDPALFLAKYFLSELSSEGIVVKNGISTSRIESEAGRWSKDSRSIIVTTYSEPLKELVRICNYKSHNLYADAICKTLGLRYKPSRGETVSSMNRGTGVIIDFWKKIGLDVDYLVMNDGSGLAPADKCSAKFFADMLSYIAKDKSLFSAFYPTLPKAGVEGSVASFLKNTKLQGKARVKSGGMTGVRSYIGYLMDGNKKYAIVVIANNYHGSMRQVSKQFEKIILDIL
jgi:D-alanyl-D-alanine carboxypeptidase/D-alanyl-D-alanine-endopeptidase (penicillin-binding protein 4)